MSLFFKRINFELIFSIKLMSSDIPLTEKESKIRKTLLTDKNGEYSVIYDLLLVVRKPLDNKTGEKHNFEGHLELTLTYHPKNNVKSGLFLNFKGEIHSLRINSQKIDKINYENHRLTIDLSLLKYKENKIRILYSGDYNHNGVGLNHYIDPLDNKEYLYTQFQPCECQRLFPCFDQPDIKAILKLKVLAPKEWRVLSNAYESSIFDFKSNEQLKIFNFSEDSIKILVDIHKIISKEYKLHIFEDTPRISTYLYALCLGSYHCIENKSSYPIKLRIFMRESLKDYGYPEDIFKIVMEGINWYSKYFGYQFPFNKYDHIFCPEYKYGAMENFGLITINEEYCFKTKPSKQNLNKRAITILHELAHMWFGNLVTMKWWDDLWLNESFATFISYLCAYKCEEFNQKYSLSWTYFNYQKGMALTFDQQIDTHPVKSEIKDSSEIENMFDNIVYKKGSSMIKQMFYYLGEKNFSNGLSQYFNEFKYKNTEFEEFVNKMIEVSGEQFKDLRDLCYNWIQKEGVNEISLDMEIESTTKKISKFIVKQKPCLEQYPNMITHFVDFLFIYDFEDDSKNKVFRKLKIEPKNETVFDFSKESAPKLVFLNYNDYGYMKLDIHYMNMTNLEYYLSKCNDPLIKSALNRALYDAFIDSKITSIEFLDIILSSIRYTQDEETFSVLLKYITSVIFIYLPLKYITKYKSKVFNILKQKLENELVLIEPNKDIIKQILIHLNGYSIEDDHNNYLIHLLNLDTDLMTQSKRYSYIKTIYSSRKISLKEKEKLLNNELKKDKTSNHSSEIKMFCDAILPDRKNKERLWKKLTEKKSFLENFEALVMGFAPIEQYDLVQDFLTEKFFEILPKLDENDEYFINIFISYLAPFQFTSDDIIQRMDNLINKYKDKENKEIYICLQEVSNSIKRKKVEEEKCEKFLKSKKKEK